MVVNLFENLEPKHIYYTKNTLLTLILSCLIKA